METESTLNIVPDHIYMMVMISFEQDRTTNRNSLVI
jgi:hypothetical protein